MRGPQERAEEAESLLGHPIFKDAVQSLRRSIVERFLALPMGSLNDRTDKLLELHAKAKLIDDLVGELRGFVNEIKLKKQKEQ